MGTVALPISGLVNVQVEIAASAAQAQNTTSCLLLTNNSIINTKVRIQAYSSLSEVGVAFGTDSIEYYAAALWFGQQPSPTELLVGKWAKTASSGMLIGAPLTEAEMAMQQWQAVVAGLFQIQVNGFPEQTIDTLDFSAQTNLNGVATVINTELTAKGVAAVCKWTGKEFTFTSTTTGQTSSVAFIEDSLQPGDIAKMLHCGTEDEPEAYTLSGIPAETALDAVSLFDLQYGYQWYALVMPECTDADHVSVAQAIQGSTNTKHFYGITTQDPATLLPNVDAGECLAQKLEEMVINKACIQYSSSSPYAVMSLLGRILTTDYSQNSTVITLMYKQEPGVKAEYLNRTQLDALTAKNCNVFIAYQGGALIIQPGVTCTSNEFIDTIVGLDNLAIEMQLNIFNLLYTSVTKVPQTDAGMNQIVGAAEQILLQYVDNGLLAPGVWGGVSFGKLAQGTYVEKGYYIYCPPIAQQSSADRAKRMAGPMTVGVKLAGAIHTVDATIFVNP